MRAPEPAPASPWWSAHVHEDRRPRLIARNRIKAAIRRYFEGEGFVEVETTALVVSPGNEAHLHAFATTAEAPDGSLQALYLHTSPEFACKKLLAAGEARLFTFAPVYRNRERGPLHHPEFTMLEWYRAGGSPDDLIADCDHVLRLACDAAGTAELRYGGHAVAVGPVSQRLTVADAFSRHAGIDLLATLGRAADLPDRDRLAEAARQAGLRVAPDDTWSDIFSRVLAALIEPHLGLGVPTYLMDYPLAEAALARPHPDDPWLAQRFELYACGVELANGFAELTDPTEQRRRFEMEMGEKARVYGRRYPLDEDFLAALADMPPASGIALGFDRLVMLATGAARIEQVLWTPVPEPGKEALNAPSEAGPGRKIERP